MRIVDSPQFARDFKWLAKKYASLKSDIRKLQQQLLQNPKMGDGIGRSCYKVRMAIASKGGGKRDGARVITYVQVVGETVFLLAIYDKSEQGSISDQRVLELLSQLES